MTTRDGRYFAVGTDGALTGRRAHEAIVDDGLNAGRPTLEGRARRASVVFHRLAFDVRLDGARAPIIVVAQRLHVDDLPGRLIGAGGWHVVELPAEDERGALLAPNVLPREKLDALRASIGSAVYARQYLQRPGVRRQRDREARVVAVPPRAVRRRAHAAAERQSDTDVPAVRTPDSFQRIIISADLTFGSEHGDYNAILVVGAASGGGRFVLDLWRRRGGLELALAAITDRVARFPNAKVVVEAAANGRAVVETLRRSKLPSVIAAPARRVPKLQRIGAVSPQIEAGSVFLPLGASWLGDFVEELAGATKHDDAQDALALALSELGPRSVSDAVPAYFSKVFVDDGSRAHESTPTSYAADYVGPKVFRAPRDVPTYAGPEDTLYTPHFRIR